MRLAILPMILLLPAIGRAEPYAMTTADVLQRGIPVQEGTEVVRTSEGDLILSLPEDDPILCDVRYAPPAATPGEPFEPGEVLVRVVPPGRGGLVWTVTGVLGAPAEIGGVVLRSGAQTGVMRMAGDCDARSGAAVTQGVLDADAMVGGRAWPAGTRFQFSGSALFVWCPDAGSEWSAMWVPGIDWFVQEECSSG
ncbi:MAG: hypothetical protein JRI25_04995 [Deltaproteobacteria bacterium]|nr:hypothetical protein [Deltaproteobacteria bacterium]MBW2253938.1 hypothetical protein [Deltaproteobacteria bacterium]